MKAEGKPLIHQLVNSHFNSNTFVFHNETMEVTAIVDPGELHPEKLLEFLAFNPSDSYSVILTHEHNDHIAGLGVLCSMFSIKLFLSQKCWENLNNPKRNLSEYLDVGNIDNITPSEIYIVSDGEKVSINNVAFTFYDTPGHSEGGICIGVRDIIFTGDTVLQYNKVTTNLPGGSKNELKTTQQKLKGILPEYAFIYPGHGDVYQTGVEKMNKHDVIYSA